MVAGQDGRRSQLALVQGHEEGVDVIRLQLAHRRRQTPAREERLELVDDRTVCRASRCGSAVGGEVAHERAAQ